MIHELRIHGLGVIEDAVVPFNRGLTVLTGETGAGKTMVLTGLGLLMGEKADPGMVRSGADRADVDGVWAVDPTDTSLVHALDEIGARVDDDDDASLLVLGRTVAAEGRSRAFAGGRSVPSAALAEISDLLVAVHGQSDQILLREPRRQRHLLDRFAGADHLARLATFRTAFEDWRHVARERAELVAHRQAREREAELLRMGIEEIAAVAPEAGEDEQLKAHAAVLANATDLAAESGAGHDLLVGGESGDQSSVSDLVGQARRLVERAAALDPGLAGLVARLDDVSAAIDDIAGELSSYAAGVEADPLRLAHVEERRQRIAGLKRKYGPGLDDVLEWWRASEEAVLAAETADDHAAELAEAEARLREQASSLTARITKDRHAAAERLAAAVGEELHALAMPEAQLRIDVSSTADPDLLTAEGGDAVAMVLSPHAGAEFRALGKGASGGELSRIMLAIEVVLAGATVTPTLVFDEVDAGIGGKVAVEVGRRLARLAQVAQVIVVTHLPQVAAFADLHVVVAKDSDGHITSASVAAVDGAERVAELVRMLSGLEGSASGAEHAAELLALADRERR
jgi:DNA repair protein RecN (Recombination protein N)